ncbi:MAG: sporulation protein YtxC [Syntrophomonadaceae bacterium]|jgi:putative sporulation protein YtxC
MLYKFQIVTKVDIDSFLNDYNKNLEWIKQRGYITSVSCEDLDDNIKLISLALEGYQSPGVFRNEDIIYIFKHQIAEILAEHVVKDWEVKLIWREIMRTCRHFSIDDRNNIYRRASGFLRKCQDNDSLNLLMSFSRKNRIAHRLFDFINSDDNAKINLEGFINFCMQDYLNELKFAVEVALEELRSQKEYNNFINLLSYFVNTQVPKIYEVNLMMNANGMFYLWDGQGIKIEEKYINYYLDEMLMEEINLDDLLISILITIAPRRIILHNIEEAKSESVETIKRVFKEKISECPGCERCYEFQPENDYNSHKH